MVIYLGTFIPNIAELTTPLCNLKKDVFELQRPLLDNIENLKPLAPCLKIVTSAPCLKIFGSKLPICF